ncbi:MAG: hypothetical protein NZ954_06530 [Thermofilaceae archaeon]|nr:hypothetical protein [Thermofilaceae archaeon]MCX8180645.1 hypothetical protein [Thermofilaceae archaeon]MDW8003749.1 hypothetical protein [Thermofilaceae archaeon]
MNKISELGLYNKYAKRIFIVKASLAQIDANVNVKALATYGRLDIIARASISAISTRHGPRYDSLFYAVFEGQPSHPIVMELKGWELKRPLLSEVDVGTMIKDALRGHTVDACFYEISFQELVGKAVAELGVHNVFYLHESGKDIRNFAFDQRSCFILGDHTGVDNKTERWLKELGVSWLSLGSTSYFTEHCITYLNGVLDFFITVSN